MFLKKVAAKYKVMAAKADRKSTWMAAFEDAVNAIDSKHAGKIEWSSAEYMFNQGMAPKEAAQKYTDNIG